jgi:3',5'-cyclic AMP phosphodiesterase CpdA
VNRLNWLAFFLCSMVHASRAHAEERLVRGPYLMDVTPHSIAVLFEVSEPHEAEVEVRTVGKPPMRVVSEPAAHHEILLSDLSPSTSYHYSVRVGDRLVEADFSTAPSDSSEPVRFLVIGDNRTNAVAHAAVVKASLAEPADFVLNTGDMVASGYLEEDWQQFFEIEGELLKRTPLFPTLGNHEYYPEGAGLQNFLKYTRVPEAGSGPQTYYAFSYGPVRILVLDSNDDWDRPTPQRRWLEDELRSANAHDGIEHILVMMHHGPISSGYHGGKAGMQAGGLVDLLRSERVSLVLSGHDHMYERGDADGLKYIVTGGGGAPLYPDNRVLPSQQKFEASYHFVRAKVTRERFEITTIRADGSRIEQCHFVGRSPWVCQADEEPSAPSASPKPASTAPRPTIGPWILVAIATAVLAFAWFWQRQRRNRSD